MITQQNITVAERLTAPTPKFWKTVGKIMGGLVTVATILVTAPVSVPAVVTTIAGYVIAAGSAVGITAITLPVDFDALSKQQGKK
ncbi:hypothetical protein GCM10027347_58810 [Larkinella harenae]